jgi:hypothetical protein
LYHQQTSMLPQSSTERKSIAHFLAPFYAHDYGPKISNLSIFIHSLFICHISFWHIKIKTAKIILQNAYAITKYYCYGYMIYHIYLEWWYVMKWNKNKSLNIVLVLLFSPFCRINPLILTYDSFGLSIIFFNYKLTM